MRFKYTPSMTFAKKLLTISSLVISIWLVIGILIYRSSSFDLFSSAQDRLHAESQLDDGEVESCRTKGHKLSATFWRKVDLQTKDIPESLTISSSQEDVLSNFTVVQDAKVHYLYAKPKLKKNLSVLLLHGLSFTAETWKKLNTIQYIAAFGYIAVAVDLPGYGYSPVAQNLNKTEFLTSFIRKLNLENVVIITPSMSGSYSLDFLLKHHKNMAGFVPVSPVGTYILDKSPCQDGTNYTATPFDKDCRKVLPYVKRIAPVLGCIKVPTLVVFGEQDKGKNSAKLCFLPNSQGAEIPDGKHAAYLSNPKLWHRLLYNFLDVLSETVSCL